ncbi:MAG: hypothetical protein QOH93_527 [Chloroflexia bacterium]|jgi:hypothetical protein|nr:hypothetical protein [Chloroflexia bacterium]
MEYLLILGALVVADLLALRYGADSRDLVNRDPVTLGLPR